MLEYNINSSFITTSTFSTGKKQLKAENTHFSEIYSKTVIKTNERTQ